MFSKKLFISLVFAGMITFSYGQNSSKKLFSPEKIGLEFTQANEKSFLFDDPDYYYKSNIIKLQFYYPLKKWKSIDFTLIIQPQHQFIRHQLYNEQFVLPSEENYLAKRVKYTKLKKLSISAVEFTIDAKKYIFNNTSVFLQFGLGIAIIDTSTERLIGGFTFLENLNSGIEISATSKTSFRIFAGIGHVSNLNFQLPNAGYNMFNSGFSIQYKLK